jgi:hypothetical protein
LYLNTCSWNHGWKILFKTYNTGLYEGFTRKSKANQATHCITCENSSVHISHNANIKKRPFYVIYLYSCSCYLIQPINILFPETVCWKWSNKKLIKKQKNKTETTKKQIIIINYDMSFFISHVISTRNTNINPRANGPRNNMGRGFICHVIWQMPCHSLFIIYFHAFFLIFVRTDRFQKP